MLLIYRNKAKKTLAEKRLFVSTISLSLPQVEYSSDSCHTGVYPDFLYNLQFTLLAVRGVCIIVWARVSHMES